MTSDQLEQLINTIVTKDDSIINTPTSNEVLTDRRTIAYSTAIKENFPVIAGLINAVKQWIGKDHIVVHESIIHSLAGN
jgi:hypothetical protein